MEEAALLIKQEGNALYANSQFEEAIEVYSRGLLESSPHSAALLFNRASAYFRIAKWAECIADCSSAIALDPNYSKALYKRALAHEQTGDFEAALVDLTHLPDVSADTQRIDAKRAAKFETDKADMIASLKILGNKVLGNFGMSTDDFKIEKDESGSFSLKMNNR